jgi:hypothetical protein
MLTCIVLEEQSNYNYSVIKTCLVLSFPATLIKIHCAHAQLLCPKYLVDYISDAFCACSVFQDGSVPVISVRASAVSRGDPPWKCAPSGR